MRNRNSLFWGVVLVLLGALLLLNTLGILTTNVWNLIWPLFLIVLGVWVLIGVFSGTRGQDMPVENATIPLDNAQQAMIQIHHGAGRLTVGGNAAPGALVQGTFGGGLEYRRNVSGNQTNLELRPRWDNRVMWGFP